jgi:molecular chaperone DnaK
VMTKLIERNTTIPTKKTETFSTAADNQHTVEVHVLQGERPMAGGNRTLGKFQLSGIPSAPRGVPQIEVSFDIDANGIVNVTAKDRGTGRSQAITITSSSGLAKDEVERMVKDAQAHAEEDQTRQGEVEARNRADSLIYQTEKTLHDNRDKLSQEDAAAAEAALQDARKSLEEGGRDRIEKAVEALTRASHRLAEALYRQTAGSAVPPERAAAGGGDGKPSGDVVDAEVVDEK